MLVLGTCTQGRWLACRWCCWAVAVVVVVGSHSHTLGTHKVCSLLSWSDHTLSPQSRAGGGVERRRGVWKIVWVLFDTGMWEAVVETPCISSVLLVGVATLG